MNSQRANASVQYSAELGCQSVSRSGKLARLINAPSWFEMRFVTLVLFFSTGAFSAFSDDRSGAVQSQEDLLSRAIWMGIYSVLVFVIAKRWTTLWKFFLTQRLLAGLLVWVFASTLWSDAPEITIRRATSLLVVTVLGVYIAERFTLKQQINMLLFALSGVAVLSLLAGLLLPQVAIMNGADTAGCWRGIVSHKNYLGRLMAMSMALCCVSTGSRIWRLAIFLLSASMLILSGSGGAILSIIVVLLCLPSIKLLQKPTRVLVTCGSFVLFLMITAVGYGYFHAGELAFWILDRLGKSTTLSGRGPLWFLCLKYISNRPWLGYGYNAFWLNYSFQISRIVHWEVPHAHNGILQVCLDIGLIGLSLFLCVYIAAICRALKTLRRARKPESIWTLVFLVFFLVSNLSESGLLGNTIYWITFISIIYSSHRFSAGGTPKTTAQSMAVGR